MRCVHSGHSDIYRLLHQTNNSYHNYILESCYTLYAIHYSCCPLQKFPLHVVSGYYKNKVCDGERRLGEGRVTGSGRGSRRRRRRRRRRRQLTEMTHNNILHTCIISLLESCAITCYRLCLSLWWEEWVGLR